MKKAIGILLLLSMLLGAAALPASAETTITIAAQSWQITKIFLEEAAAAFEAAHPGVNVEFVTIADDFAYSAVTIGWARGETDVDVVVLGTASLASQYVAKDLLFDFENDLRFFDDFPKEEFLGVGLQQGSFGGKIYGIPCIVESYALNVKNAAAREAGYWQEDKDMAVIPQSWDEFYEMAKAMHKVENGVVVQQGAVIQWGISMYATLIAAKQAMDGTVFDANGVLSFESENFRHMLEVWQKGAKEGIFSKETYADNMAGRNSFKSGITALLFETGGAFVEANKNLGAGTASLSAFPGADQRGSIGFSAIAVMPKCGKNADLAVAFIKEGILGEHSQTNTMNVYGKMPSVIRYFENANVKDWQFLSGIADKSAEMPKYQDAAKFTSEIIAIIQSYLDENVDLDTCMGNIQTLIDSCNKAEF